MKYIITEDATLLDALGKGFPECSKTTLRSWLKDERIAVNGIIQKIGTFPVRKNQIIEFGSKARFLDNGVQIYFEDQHLVVIDKPEGLLSVSTAFEKSKTAHSILKLHYRPKKVQVVHRIDQDTSGIMMFALTEECRDALKVIFEKHEIEREYSAVVEGKVEGDGAWESYMYEDANYVVHETTEPGKGRLAKTYYETLTSSKKYTLLNLKLETGRKNQIRVHCQSAGHPIVGDKKYGAVSNPIKRLCLHARLLAFTHPITSKEMRFESEMPKEFYQILGLQR